MLKFKFNIFIEKGTRFLLIQREIENILAEKILRGELVDGQNVKLNYENESLIFEVGNSVVKI